MREPLFNRTRPGPPNVLPMTHRVPPPAARLAHKQYERRRQQRGDGHRHHAQRRRHDAAPAAAPARRWRPAARTPKRGGRGPQLAHVTQGNAPGGSHTATPSSRPSATAASTAPNAIASRTVAVKNTRSAPALAGRGGGTGGETAGSRHGCRRTPRPPPAAARSSARRSAPASGHLQPIRSTPTSPRCAPQPPRPRRPDKRAEYYWPRGTRANRLPSGSSNSDHQPKGCSTGGSGNFTPRALSS